MTEYNFSLLTAFANSAPSNEIEPFPDYDRGLGIAFVETDGKPEMKGLNGLFSLMTVSLLALKQRGILNWTTGFEYKQGAFVVEANKLYQAKVDNTSKQPSLSQNEWQVWASVSDIDVDTNGNIIKTAKAGGAFTLKVEDATTTTKGVARFATATEVANKSNVSAAVTPKNVADMLSSNIVVESGIVFDGGTIPLPKGFTEAQCKWMVSPSDTTLCSLGANNQGADFFQLKCFTTGRVVTAQISFYNNTTGFSNTYNKSYSANYIIIGVK